MIKVDILSLMEQKRQLSISRKNVRAPAVTTHPILYSGVVSRAAVSYGIHTAGSCALHTVKVA